MRAYLLSAIITFCCLLCGFIGGFSTSWLLNQNATYNFNLEIPCVAPAQERGRNQQTVNPL